MGFARLSHRLLVWVVRSAVAGTVTAAGAWLLSHGLAGTTWTVVGTILRAVPLHTVGLLAMTWLGGLVIYATVLAASLPGLGVRRGLVLNLSGSAIANVLPVGGAVATALNWHMVRTWGFSSRSFGRYCVLTNALDVATKLLLPIVAVVFLAARDVPVPGLLWGVAASCVMLLGAGALVSTVGHRSPAPSASGRGRASRLWHSARGVLDDVRAAFAAGWRRLVPASIAYAGMQVLLLAMSLHAVGVTPGIGVVLMAAAIERLGSLLPLSPGAVGIAELGPVAWLIASGQSPAGAVAGVLLYRLFLVAAEIPLGSAVLGGWWARHRLPWGRRRMSCAP